MMIFHAPSPFEAPSKSRSKFEYFGQGPDAARRLARRLNASQVSAQIIVLGTAGALKESLKPGDCFLIRELLRIGKPKIVIPISEELSNFPSATCITMDEPILMSAVKAEISRQTQADLVDCEMYDLYSELRPDLRTHCIFVRGVIDRAKDEIDFITNYRLDFKKLAYPDRWYSFFKLIFSYWRYQTKINEFFQRLHIATIAPAHAIQRVGNLS